MSLELGKNHKDICSFIYFLYVKNLREVAPTSTPYHGNGIIFPHRILDSGNHL